MPVQVACPERETRAAPGCGPRPCPRAGGSRLKALFVCLCALVLATQASAVAKRDATAPAPPTAEAGKRAATSGKPKKVSTAQLEKRLARKLRDARRHRGTIRFFKNRRYLLRADDHAAKAQKALRRAHYRLAKTRREIASIRRELRKRERVRRAALPPRKAICEVFGDRYCGEAISVAWCESRLVTTARNGQYLGIFQMGSYARDLYGHGDTAYDQAEAAHGYFVDSGRDWSPWTCRWAAY